MSSFANFVNNHHRDARVWLNIALHNEEHKNRKKSKCDKRHCRILTLTWRYVPQRDQKKANPLNCWSTVFGQMKKKKQVDHDDAREITAVWCWNDKKTKFRGGHLGYLTAIIDWLWVLDKPVLYIYGKTHLYQFC